MLRRSTSSPARYNHSQTFAVCYRSLRSLLGEGAVAEKNQFDLTACLSYENERYPKLIVVLVIFVSKYLVLSIILIKFALVSEF